MSRLAAADTLLVLGDSLSAGYQMSASKAWPSLLDKNWQQQPRVINASISGDTAAQGLARLPALLKQHQPQWVLIELGGNDGLRGFPPKDIEQTLSTIIEQVKTARAKPILMQVRLPANYAAVIRMRSARFIRSWRNSTIFLYCPFSWSRFI